MNKLATAAHESWLSVGLPIGLRGTLLTSYYFAYSSSICGRADAECRSRSAAVRDDLEKEKKKDGKSFLVTAESADYILHTDEAECLFD
jgi:hypothetical protein